MTVEQICHVGKIELNNENIALITNLQNQISTWLESTKFKEQIIGKDNQTYATLPYPPLLDPDSINYFTSEASICWRLNIPLPPFYDFMLFGTHGVGFAAIPKLLNILGCGTAGRDSEKQAPFIYESLFEQLVKCKKEKSAGIIKAIALYLCDFPTDADNDKLFALIACKNVILIDRDPISLLKACCNLQLDKAESEEDDFSQLDQNDKMVQKIQRTRRKKLVYTLDKDPKELLKDKVHYRVGIEKNAYSDKPNASGCQLWMRELLQGYHNGLMASSLVRLGDFRVMQTKDFSGKNTFDTLKKLANEFGFNKPDESQKELLKSRVSDLKCFIPAILLLNPQDIKGKDGKAQKISFDDILLLELHSKFSVSRDNITVNGFNLPEFFEVQVNNANDIEKINQSGLANEIQAYLSKLCAAVMEQNEIENAKKITEDDVLEYFKANPQSALLFDGLLVSHLRPIKESGNENILNDWGYYQRFKQIVNNIDDEGFCYRLCRKNDDKSYVFVKFNKKEIKEKEKKQ